MLTAHCLLSDWLPFVTVVLLYYDQVIETTELFSPFSDWLPYKTVEKEWK